MGRQRQMTSSMETFMLEWDQFQENMTTSFKTFRSDGELFDITLACDDGQLEAHKVILSASSNFFRQIIKRNPHPHPLLYLKGVDIDVCKSLLDFMYLGKAKVKQETVNMFLTLGEELGVKGLVQGKEKGGNKSPEQDKNDHHMKKVENTALFLDPRISIGGSES